MFRLSRPLANRLPSQRPTAPRDKREHSESVLGIDVKRNYFSDNFRAESNWKINHPPSEVRKLRPGREKYLVRSYIPSQAGRNVILASQPGPYRPGGSLPGKLQRPFPASGRRKTQNSSSYKWLTLWMRCDKTILTHS